VTSSSESSASFALGAPAGAGKGSVLLERIKAKLGSALLDATLSLDDAVITVDRKHLLDVVKILKLDSELHFNLLSSVTAVDWMDQRATRYEVVYHFVSLAHGFILRMKVPVSEEDPSVDSLTGIYGGANFMERECWDMVGITFKGHPDLRRILMYDEFKGHPLRKDYPVQGKQPRVRLISPEVTNTARDMNRPALYSINKRVN
jgi:NADH-quinone oxidoreductase subunit C